MAVAIAEECPIYLPNLQPLWDRKAPRRLAENCPADDPFGGWKVWQELLRARKKPAAPPFLEKKRSPLVWGWPENLERDVIQAAIASPATLAEIVIGDDPAAPPDLPLSLQMVALAYAMPRLADELPAETWWYLVERLHSTAMQAHSQRVDWSTEPGDAVRNQLLAGELPLALGYLLPEVRALRALRSNARTALSDAIIELTDGEGLPHARLLPVLGPLFACWTRARWLGAQLCHGSWSRQAEQQYQWLVRCAIRMADAGGRFLLTTPDTREYAEAISDGRSWNKPLFKLALELAGDRGDWAADADALPHGIVPKKLKCRVSDRPTPSLNSDWSGITIMSDGWSQSDVRLAVAYADDPMTIELSADGERLFAGAWKIATTCDGKTAKPIGDWEQLCWESGKRFDFLELGLSLSEGLRLERQLLLAREDRVLYLADIIITADRAPRQLQHSIILPLDSRARWRPESETRDGMITGRKLRAAVLPLALTEWRSDPRSGSLTETDGALVLSLAANGRALCCPLFIDLDRKQAKKNRTWRQLTVAENMEVLPRDVAVGFRAQSGADQWLFYRSLGPAGNRTVMGQNIAGEFSAGPFYTTGKYKEWVEIEAV